VAPPSPLLAVPNVTAHLSTASVPITVLLYDGPLLCGFNVAIKGLIGLIERCQNATSNMTRSSAIADKPRELVCKVVEVWQDFLSEYIDIKFTYICYRRLIRHE